MTNRNIVQVIVCLFALGFLLGAEAQDNLIFDLDDFIDPKERGYRFAGDSSDEILGTDFLVFVGGLGYARNLEYADEPYTVNSTFENLTVDWYKGRFQFGLQANHFSDRLLRQGSTFVEAQFSIYGLLSNSVSGNPAISRTSFFLAQGTDSNGDNFSEARFLVDVSLQDQQLSKYPFGGGWEYRFRDRNLGVERHTLKYRFRKACRVRGLTRLTCGLSIGGFRENGTERWAPAEIELGYEFPIKFISRELTGHIRYFPSYDPNAVCGQDHWNHQFAVFVNYPLYKKLWRG